MTRTALIAGLVALGVSTVVTQNYADTQQAVGPSPTTYISPALGNQKALSDLHSLVTSGLYSSTDYENLLAGMAAGNKAGVRTVSSPSINLGTSCGLRGPDGKQACLTSSVRSAVTDPGLSSLISTVQAFPDKKSPTGTICVNASGQHAATKTYSIHGSNGDVFPETGSGCFTGYAPDVVYWIEAPGGRITGHPTQQGCGPANPTGAQLCMSVQMFSADSHGHDVPAGTPNPQNGPLTFDVAF